MIVKLKNKIAATLCAITGCIVMDSCTPTIVVRDSLISIGESDEQIEIKDYWSSATVIPLIEDTTDVLGEVSQIRYKNGKLFCS